MQKGMPNKTIRLVKYDELQATVVAQVAMAVQLGWNELVNVEANSSITQRSRMLPMKYDDRGLTKQLLSSEVVYSLYTPRNELFWSSSKKNDELERLHERFFVSGCLGN